MSKQIRIRVGSCHYLQCLSLRYFAAALLGASFFVSQVLYAYADDDVNQVFDASEFNATLFNDADLAKHNFKDFNVSTGGRQKSKAPLFKAELLGRNEAREASLARRVFLKEEENAPIKELAGDWVPAKLDLTANGAFGTADFNGAPVPYNLNGHVDAERGKP